MMKRKLTALLLAVLLVCQASFLLAGCAEQESENESTSGTSATEPIDVRVASLKGPTSLGIVHLISDARAGDAQTQNNYEFTISGTIDEILPSLISGDLDIALIPANAASVLYNKTEGGVKVMNINTLGVLYIVSADASIDSIDDLAGRTLYLTGKGTTPEFVMNALLSEAGMAGEVTLEFKSEATELAAAVIADPTAIALMPEPYATSVMMKNTDLHRNLSIPEIWKETMGEELVTAVTVVRSQFAEDHPEIVAEFQALHEASVAAALADPAATAPLVVELGIVENAEVAERAIPQCTLVSLAGTELKDALRSYLELLYAQDATSIGGAMPSDDFYI